jgi:hypothetical protein
MGHPHFMAAFFEAQHRLGLSHGDLAKLIGVSRRTAERWSQGTSTPASFQVARLAVAVHHRDVGLALKLASAAGKSLEDLGVVPPPASPPSPPPVTPLLVEAVVSAAAEALDVSPRVARPALLAAVERAKAAGLGLDDLLAVLRPTSPAKKARA